MTIAYVRHDKGYESIHEQLQLLNSYAVSKNLTIDDEFVDQNFLSQRLSERVNITEYFQSKKEVTLLITDSWVLSSNMEDITQMFSCLLKNNYEIHFVKQSVVVTQASSSMLVLGLLEQIRQSIQSNQKREIGRPKGSRSASKFDKYLDVILDFIRDKKSVSYMARELNISRSSLKDFIDSRDLKELAFNTVVPLKKRDAEEMVIKTIICPNQNKD